MTEHNTNNTNDLKNNSLPTACQSFDNRLTKVLITGANSYVGTSFEKWLAQWPDKYVVDSPLC